MGAVGRTEWRQFWGDGQEIRGEEAAENMHGQVEDEERIEVTAQLQGEEEMVAEG